ncbi:exodeoxyribonuclease X [Chelatococcus caeni]|uniref:Exodeoxyribonuclease X n=1 Tax=Chelatococcus caeni TaxID=1348468 RepID=A0A840C1G9_9HYPH|nr:exonuclease domain-containing protein [Chelatococcus caeni]MBB4017339.1 exodeoxyribonuclease X [Chelatococcus caeni]
MRIRVVDLETTGFAPPEDGVGTGVCDLGWVDLVPTSAEFLGWPREWTICPMVQMYVHPGHAIPAKASAIHHIVDEDVACAPSWPEALEMVAAPADATMFAAHNAKFERQWFTDEVLAGRPIICTYKCALRLWPDAPGHSNQALRYWRNPEGLDRHVADFAHRAGPDAYVTAHLLRDMLQIATIDELVQWSSEPALLVTCHIGRYRGTPWRDIDSGFLWWVLERDFDEDVHHTCRYWLDQRRAEAAAGEVA